MTKRDRASHLTQIGDTAVGYPQLVLSEKEMDRIGPKNPVWIGSRCRLNQKQLHAEGFSSSVKIGTSFDEFLVYPLSGKDCGSLQKILHSACCLEGSLSTRSPAWKPEMCLFDQRAHP